MTDIVVAKFTENINWLSRLTSGYRRVIYCKNENEDNEFIRKNMLPNIGRESHTYLSHIVANYDQLTDYTVFVQGDPLPHCPNIIQMLNGIELSATFRYCDFDFMALGKGWIAEDDARGFPNHPYLPIHRYTPEIGIQREKYRFVPGANFIVSERAIRFHSKHYYERLLDLHNREEMMPWIMERLWAYIFKFQ